MAKKRSSLLARATARATLGGTACKFCKIPEVKAEVQEVLKARMAGTPTVSIRELFYILKEEYPQVAARHWTALRDHIHRCEEGWGGKI